MQILYNYRHICVTLWYTIIYLDCSSHNIARCGFCLIMLNLPDYPASLIVYVCHWSVTVFITICVSYCTATVTCWCLSYVKTYCKMSWNMFTWLMLLCPNITRSLLLPAYLSWSGHGKGFLTRCLLFSHVSFILSPCCLFVSLCSKCVCPGGCIVQVSAIMSFLSISIKLECSCSYS